MMRIVNIFAGPGCGKSTTAAALFAELKYRGVNCEYVTEYAKDAVWERRGPKVFEAQEYIFGKQNFKLARVIEEVDLIVTDSPILLGLVYMPEGYPIQSLRETIREAFFLYDSLNIFLTRDEARGYNPKGRNQTADEAKQKDREILSMLDEHKVPYFKVPFSRQTPEAIIQLILASPWADKIPNIKG
jgi:nicotinamide riboside kinase